ncbi:MAG: hypothetical protein KF902_06225 [Phycisphaeraceae bacterium]|nr:hypothetical protein [Phycisphaeraceae bacterium]
MSNSIPKPMHGYLIALGTALLSGALATCGTLWVNEQERAARQREQAELRAAHVLDEMWRVRDEYDAIMRTGVRLGGHMDLLIQQMHSMMRYGLDWASSDPLPQLSPHFTADAQRVAIEISTLVQQAIPEWAAARSGVEARIQRYFGGEVAALAMTPPTSLDLDVFMEFSTVHRSFTEEMILKDAAGRQAWASESRTLLDRTMTEYGDGAGAVLSTWRESVLTRMDQRIAEREGSRAAAASE